MNHSPGAMPDPSNTGRPADNWVSKTQRHRLAHALVTLHQTTGNYISHREARAVIDDHARRGADELDAYLRTTFHLDPTGVTAVRNVSRERASR